MQKHTVIHVNDTSLVSSTADDASQENALFTSHNFSWEGTLHDLKQLPPNLGGWIQLFLRLQIKGIKSDRTFQAMDRDLRYFYDFFVEYLGNEIITSWTPQLTQRFMQSREDAFHEKPATVSRRLRSLSIFANWVNSIRPEWFTLGHPTKGVKEPVQQALSPKGLTNPQVRLLIDAAHNLIAQKQIKKKSTRGRSTTIQRPYRDFAVLILMLNTGIRREEVCNLTREQFSAHDKKLTNVKCKGNIVRNILLSKETVAAIETYFAEERPQDQAVFTETSALFLASGSRRRSEDQCKLSVRAINSIIAKLETEANAHLNPDKQFRVQPHTLRHTHAYHLLESGRDLAYIQKRLGHQSMQFLVRYTQMPEAQEAEMLDTIEFK